MKDEKIDFVITWVDGSDPDWLAERALFESNAEGDFSENRFRDWGLLKYWFRGVEKYASWVNKIYFVTWGHIPDWLDIKNPKLCIIKHTDFIPKEYLPTYNTNTIELNLHRIDGLSESFVYFNDDMFLLRPTKKTEFFYDGLPCDSAVLTALLPTERMINHIIYNNMEIINKYFDKNNIFNRFLSYKYGLYNVKSLLMLPFNKYTAFQDFHCHLNLRKKTMQEVWNREFNRLDSSCKNKFRTNNDISIWLMRYWQLASGNFITSKIHDKYHEIQEDALEHIIKKQKKRVICINDVLTTNDISYINSLQLKLLSFFNDVFQNKSSFELT